MDKSAEDGASAGVALGLEALLDLGDGIGMLAQPLADERFVRIELAGAWGALGLDVTFLPQVLADGAAVQSQLAGDLGSGEVTLALQVVKLTIRVIIDHGMNSFSFIY